MRKVKIHKKEYCTGACPIHSPSNHNMKDQLLEIDLLNDGLALRVCSHGVSHPDKDSVKFLVATKTEQYVTNFTGGSMSDQDRKETATIFYSYNYSQHDCCEERCCQN